MLNQTSPSDNDVARRIQARDEAAFELLYTRYNEALARHVCSIVRSEAEAAAVAQDLVQETFLRVWTSAEQWSGQGSFKSWLYRIVTNLALNHLRAARRHPSQPFAGEEYRPPDEWSEEQETLAPGWLVDTSTLGPHAALEQAEEQARLNLAIEGLPEEKREVFRLVYEMELSIRDTAGRLGIPEGTVKSRLHPLACALLNADFDGDQVAVYLPLGDDAQREAGEKLSIAAHLTRDPQLVAQLLPPHEGIWGLADLSLDENGRKQIAGILHVAPVRIGSPLPQSEIVTMLVQILEREGVRAVLQATDSFARLGYARASATGASLSPFASSQVALPAAPAGDAPTDWEDYLETCAEAVLSGRDYTSPNLGPQLLSAAVRLRSRRFLPMLVGPRWLAKDTNGNTVIIRSSWVEGRTSQELFASTAGAREGLAKPAFDSEEILQDSARSGGAIGGPSPYWPALAASGAPASSLPAPPSAAKPTRSPISKPA